MAFIEIKNLSYEYEIEEGKRAKALDGVSLSIEKGSFVAILGHNGSGKSTLVKLLSAVLELQSGEIIIDGVSLDSSISDEDYISIRRRVGMVFQNPDDQLVATVVEEDIAFGPENLGVPPCEIEKRVKDALEKVGMTAYAKHAPHRLSGGQKQRIAIAGILAMLPECIIFDEATAMLDPVGRESVMELIRALHRDGITTLFITHNMDEAKLADRIVVLNRGKVYMEGTPKEVFSRADELFSIGLEVPQSTSLAIELKKLGMDIDTSVISEEECADSIARIINKGF